MRQLTEKDLAPASVRGSHHLTSLVAGVFMVLGALRLLTSWGISAEEAVLLQGGITLVIAQLMGIVAKVASGRTLAMLEQRETKAYSEGLHEEAPKVERGLEE